MNRTLRVEWTSMESPIDLEILILNQMVICGQVLKRIWSVMLEDGGHLWAEMVGHVDWWVTG